MTSRGAIATCIYYFHGDVVRRWYLHAVRKIEHGYSLSEAEIRKSRCNLKIYTAGNAASPRVLTTQLQIIKGY